MNKSKVLSVVLAGAMVAAMGAMTASAADLSKDSVGLCGEHNNWGNDGAADVVMTDADGDGIFEGTITVDPATVEAAADGLEFKVRTNNDWTDSWGALDENEMTFNSQTNCKTDPLTEKSDIVVKFDTTGGDEMTYAVSFEVKAAAAADEPTTDEPTTDEPTTDEPTTDAPATGDTTSAFALVSVVVAALGVAVVMTKKASSK